MAEHIVIDRQYRGPQKSGNGGFSAGLLAEAYGAPAEVTLRMPPPLDRPLDVLRTDDVVVLRDGDAVVAEARPAPSMADLVPPRVVTVDEAAAASASYAGLDAHLFPECFACGPARAEGDGLRVFPGPAGDGLLAAVWRPDRSVAGDDGAVRSAAVWAALDCPSGWAGELSAARPAVLGRLAVDQRRAVEVGESLVVLGWPLEDQPKKFLAASALVDPDGAVVAVAKATWVRIDATKWTAQT